MNPIDYYLQAGAKVTSPYGMRVHPKDKVKRMHYGTDIGGKPRGYVWRTPYAGIITHLGEHGTRGKVVVQRIEDLPLLQITQHHDDYRCRVGDMMEPGWPLGTNGTSGNVTGPHLHYELRWDNGTPLGGPVWGDPQEFDLAKVRKELAMAEYYTVKQGDVAWKIAKDNGITLGQMAAWNQDISDLNKIYPGQRIRVKAPKDAPAPGVSQENFNTLALRVKALEDTLSNIKKALYQG